MSDDKDQMTPADFWNFSQTARPARLQKIINERDDTIRTLQEQVKKARNDALEEAARVAEGHFVYGHAVAGPEFAAASASKIRSLKANGESE